MTGGGGSDLVFSDAMCRWWLVSVSQRRLYRRPRSRYQAEPAKSTTARAAPVELGACAVPNPSRRTGSRDSQARRTHVSAGASGGQQPSHASHRSLLRALGVGVLGLDDAAQERAEGSIAHLNSNGLQDDGSPVEVRHILPVTECFAQGAVTAYGVARWLTAEVPLVGGQCVLVPGRRHLDTLMASERTPFPCTAPGSKATSGSWSPTPCALVRRFSARDCASHTPLLITALPVRREAVLRLRAAAG